MQRGEVRIIAGKWRGRKLKVPPIRELRPTPDRVRETLFNWLAPTLAGAHCLDPFAGSGVLGFEALSRGAAHVVMIDQSLDVVRLLQAELAQFGANNADIYCATVPQQLKPVQKPFDIVFLDPPYQHNLLLPTCYYLEQHGFLAANASIYLEAKEAITAEVLPPHWHLRKSQRAGHVFYHLAERERE
jgi:16S rRNA (guanine966-N2)-methyltransferase